MAESKVTAPSVKSRVGETFKELGIIFGVYFAILFLPFGNAFADGSDSIVDTFITQSLEVLNQIIMVGTVVAILAVAVCLLMSIVATDERDKQRMKKFIINILVCWVLLILITQIFNWIMNIFGIGSSSDLTSEVDTTFFTAPTTSSSASSGGSSA